MPPEKFLRHPFVPDVPTRTSPATCSLSRGVTTPTPTLRSWLMTIAAVELSAVPFAPTCNRMRFPWLPGIQSSLAWITIRPVAKL